jgi:hypothetical protein
MAILFFMSYCPYGKIRNFVKFCSFFFKFVDTSQLLLKSNDHKVRFTRRPTYVYDIAPCFVNGEIMLYNVACSILCAFL